MTTFLWAHSAMLVHCASLAPQLAATSWNKPTQRKKKEELNVTSGIYHGSSKQPRSKFMNPFIIELHKRRPRTKRTNIIKRRWGCSFGIFGFAD